MKTNKNSQQNALKNLKVEPNVGMPPETTINPITKLAMAAAGIAAGIIADKVLKRLWESFFKEHVPDKRFAKDAAKDLKVRQKLAKKSGASKSEIKDMTSDYDRIPAWRLALWTFVSTSAIAGAKILATKGAQKGANKLVFRRPSNRRG